MKKLFLCKKCLQIYYHTSEQCPICHNLMNEVSVDLSQWNSLSLFSKKEIINKNMEINVNELFDDDILERKFAPIEEDIKQTYSNDNYTFCPYCGKQVIDSVSRYCAYCGKHFNNFNKVSNTLKKQDAIIQLKNYKKIINCTCRECGYTGPMGIIKENYSPMWKKIIAWILKIACVISIPFTFFISLLLLVPIYFIIDTALDQNIKLLFCPNCKRTLKSNK